MNLVRNAWSFHGVRGTGIDGVWGAVWKCLEPAVKLTRGRYDEASVREAIRRGDCQLWMAGPLHDPNRLAVVTELVVYPKQKWCRIVFVGGNGLPLAFDFLGTIEAWARTQGCVGVEAGGRAEWKRLLASRGYAEDGMWFARKLDA